MFVEAWGMIAAGAVALIVGLVLVRPRFMEASGPAQIFAPRLLAPKILVPRILVLGPVFEAVALAIFAAEHFLMARDLAPIVPRWLPGPLFWTYFVGVALLAAAISLIGWRCVRWSASLLALFFLLIVFLVDLPNLPQQFHERFFWILLVRETSFAGGAMALAGSVWPRERATRALMLFLGRLFVGSTFIFYAVEHFLFPRFVPGVPLEKMMPAWAPAMLLACVTGIVLLASGVGLLFFPRFRSAAAAAAGTVLVLLTLFFYVPILITEIHTSLAVEGVNYVGDTLLFAATALLAGLGADAEPFVGAQVVEPQG